MSSVLVLSVFVFSSCSRKDKKQVVIKGSTTVLPIAQKAAEKYSLIDRSVSISISGSGSGDGIKSIIEGTCDIANSSRDLKDKEKENIKSAGKNIKGIVIALDMILPVVHPSNPVKELTIDQLKAIYKGEIINWKVLGGKDENIVVISRDTSSGTYEVWDEKIMKKEKVMPGALLQASNGAIVSAVSANEKAIGYIGFGYLNDSIKAVNVDGVEPTLENGKSKKYPVSRDLFMFINEDTLSPEAKKFIDFIKSSEGQSLVTAAGFIAI
ncbi:MAG: phosphate ABC transporter substrate-binding protein [Spirochaetes bacterium]|nr:phosphate ABC transporter substrate-binding protein [Spirochaetota bacterium]